MSYASVSDAQRDALLKIMNKDFMSSEESGEEILDGERKSVIQVRPLPWRASHLQRILKQLDRKMDRRKSKQSRQQTLPRVVGSVSTRSRPFGFADDFFGFQHGT